MKEYYSSLFAYANYELQELSSYITLKKLPGLMGWEHICYMQRNQVQSRYEIIIGFKLFLAIIDNQIYLF